MPVLAAGQLAVSLSPLDDFKGKDLGVKSWPADHWQTGGGTMWGWIQYDPELNLIYYGTGNPGPWNSNERPGAAPAQPPAGTTAQ